MSDKADVIIIGAGIAGASLAFELAEHLDVVLLEQESQPGYHSTGRSAAMLIETYGSQAVQRLTRQGRAFFEQPPSGFVDQPLLSPRGYLQIARSDQLDKLNQYYEVAKAVLPSIRRFNGDEVCRWAPQIDRSYVEAGFLEPHAMAIDVAALHQGYIKGFAKRGGRLMTNALVMEIRFGQEAWMVTEKTRSLSAPILVNAAGAWADQLASSAGIKTIGLSPKRRTAILIDPPNGADIESWPMVTDIDDEFYVKPEGGALLVSPADETPSHPTDAQPEDLDIALAADRYEKLTGLSVKKINHSWSGLRSFVRDHDPVLGFDPDCRGFFWLAGQGGFGIMTAPGAAQLASALIKGQTLPAGHRRLAEDISPARLR